MEQIRINARLTIATLTLTAFLILTAQPLANTIARRAANAGCKCPECGTRGPDWKSRSPHIHRHADEHAPGYSDFSVARYDQL